MRLVRRLRPVLTLGNERVTLRPPLAQDYDEWSALRRSSRAFLEPWEPSWSHDHLSARSYRNRVAWADRAIRAGEAVPLLIFDAGREVMIGGITLSNIRRYPSLAASLGYWLGEPFVGRGYMTEAIGILREHAFEEMGLGRLEAACLSDNVPSRRLLERCGFGFEGVARAYLQINGRWRDHLLYASVRPDRAAL